MKTIDLIGNTPMVEILNGQISIKLEKFNVGGSVKDRAVLCMMQDAICNQIIDKNSVIIEATSGNTGIALAMLGKVLGYKVEIVMPDTMSIERRQLILAYGAKLTLTSGSLGMPGAIKYVDEKLKEDSVYVSLGQFNNDYNVVAHYTTTGPEIYQQVNDVDIFVSCAGTGGTFSGVSKYLKEQNKDIKCYVGEPSESAVLSGENAGKHSIQGIGAGFKPEIVDLSLANDILKVSSEDAIKETIEFVRETGILVGISSGANIYLAKQLAKKYPDKKIVTIAPDGGEKYLSILNFEG